MKKLSLIILALLITFSVLSCDSLTEAETEVTTEETTYTTVEINEEISDEVDWSEAEYDDYESKDYFVLNESSESYEITEKGTYVLSGTITETIVINVDEDDDVDLILNNVTIITEENAAIIFISADEATITVLEGTVNYIEDSSTYTTEYEEYNSTIYSDTDLIINGTGTLNVVANYNNAIVCKDDLMIVNATINIESVDDGINGKDSLTIQNATITMDVSGDGFKSTQDEDTEEGYIYFESGTFSIDSGADAIDAYNYVIIAGGDFYLDSYDKGITAGTYVYISGGDLVIDSTDDAINADVHVEISGGTIEIDSFDDGIHAETSITINGGDITILDCYEGIESLIITINDGTIFINATDDGINATDGTGGDRNADQSAGGSELYINGGLLTIYTASSEGDCIDVNGTMYMTDGELYLYSYYNSPDSGIDCNVDCFVSGGTIFATGSNRMSEAPSDASEQASIMFISSQYLQSNTLVSIYDSEGTLIFEANLELIAQNIVISTSLLEVGEDYILVIEGYTTVEFEQESTVTYLNEDGVREELEVENPDDGSSEPTRPGR